MSCISDGDLRARWDGGLEAEQEARAAAHLRECGRCRARAEELGARANWVAAALDPGVEAAPASAAAGWARWQARAGGEAGNGRWPRWAWASAAVVVIAACAAWPPARSRAADILAMLRVEKVTVAPVSLPLAGQPDAQRAVGQMIQQMVSQSLVVTMKPSPPQAAATAAAAEALAGFPLRLPANATPTGISVSGEAAFQMTVDRARVQAIIDETGRPDLQLPAAVNGALVAVHIPKGVLAEYGSCPPPGARHAGRATYPDCVRLREVPSPTLSVPPNLNLDALAEIGLQIAGMSADEAAAFCRTVDWRSTLVIPVERDEDTYRRLPVDGVQGILLQQSDARPRQAAEYALVWVRDGVIYSLTGRGDPATATSMAAAMQ